MPEAQTPRTIVPGLQSAHIKLARSEFNTWSVTPAPGIKAKDLEVPEYWRHVVREKGIRPADRIEALAQDGSWWGLFLVQYTTERDLRLTPLLVKELDSSADIDADTETHFVKWVSPVLKFCVVRKSDKARVREGFARKQDAILWMNQNAQTLKAA